MVTEGDFLRRSEIGTERRRPKWLEFVLGPGRMAEEYVHVAGRRVEDVMTRDPVVVGEDRTIHVLEEDDGVGMQPRSGSQTRCYGLAGIKERIAVLGGVARVISAKGKGTRIEIAVPAGEPAAPSVEHAPARVAAQAAARPN